MLDKKGKILLGIDTNYIWGGVRVRVMVFNSTFNNISVI
jgi:hypothetical protein